MDAELLERSSQELPVLPLPDVVLMPGALLPLHIFEPRYRALIKHCRGGEGVMGIATLRPGFESDYYGEPPIFREVGVGEADLDDLGAEALVLLDRGLDRLGHRRVEPLAEVLLGQADPEPLDLVVETGRVVGDRLLGAGGVAGARAPR